MNERLSNLYLFPATHGEKSGYSIAVTSDLKHFNPGINDYMVFITENPIKSGSSCKTIYINRNTILFRVFNFLSTGHPSFFSGIYLYIKIFLAFRQSKFNMVFFGDINFYNLSCYVNANHKIYRLHNLYLKMYKNIREKKLLFYNFQLLYECLIGKKIERRLIKDCKMNPKFELSMITDEEKDFIKENFKIPCQTLSVSVNIKTIKNVDELFIWDRRIIWFGGLSTHKTIGIDYFLKNIFPKIKNKIGNVKFELIGMGSNKYTDLSNSVYGHGFIDNFSYGDYQNSVFINPDIVGGGIKLKLFNLFEANAHCLTTSLGLEGFPYKKQWTNLRIYSLEDWDDYFFKLSR